jgi:hypothetical protein
MDSLITAAARALAAGDPLGALNRVALRDDAPALALRGIAMAQLGDFERARILVRRAVRAFGVHEPVSRARCIVAEAEIAFASRDLGWPAKTLETARATLQAHGDHANAAHAHYLAVRRRLLPGHLDDAERALARLDPAQLPPALQATHHLLAAGIAMRRLQAAAARAALDRARRAARSAGIPALAAEIESATRALDMPAARLFRGGTQRLLRPVEIERLLASDAVVVDACRHTVRCAGMAVPLASRPVLFTLARALGEAWPSDVARDVLVARAFRLRRADESLRARLRVEIGRLRKALQPFAGIGATRHGFALLPRDGRDVALLAPPQEEKHAALLAFLADGESWSSSALALALGASQRTVQRALETLAETGQVQSFGRGRARRWVTPPMPGLATSLLLTLPLPDA